MAALAALVVGALLTVGCGGSSNDATGPSGGSAHAAGEKKLKIMFVGHGAPSGDPAVQVVLNGFKAGLRTFNAEGEYRGPHNTGFNAADIAKLMDQALATRPDGLVLTDPTPPGLNAKIKQIVDSGIPVVITNLGAGQARATGALTAVVNDEVSNGKAAGDRLRAAGVQHPLLMTIPPGIPVADERNKGFLDAFPAGSVIKLEVPLANLNNPVAVSKALQASLAKHPEADGVLSVGELFNAPMLTARGTLGDRANQMHWATIDVGPQVVTALKARQMDFAVDSQHYLEGFLPVQFLAFYIRYGLVPPLPDTLVGPQFVTSDNVDKMDAAIKAGVRGS
ncbi:MAG TPA: substrate-binding domain-containing protein [Conexibacter sp.]